MVSAAPSSAHKKITSPSGARPSPHGHAPPVVTVLAITIDTCDLPSPASPATSVNFPTAMRPGHNHSGGLTGMSAAHCMMSARFGDVGIPSHENVALPPLRRHGRAFGFNLKILSLSAKRGSGGGNSTVIARPQATRR
jgi:hypothetical protein